MAEKAVYGFPLPEDFLLGTANSAFQCEGAIDRDGKSENVIEHCVRQYGGTRPGTRSKEVTGELPDRGCFFYDNYEAYIEDMQKTGQSAYRLSLAWPRIIPTGVGAVNPKGIEFYNRVIDKLISCGITPFVDLNHWDMPQCLVEKGGFASPDFPDWFEAYAKVCFEAFGDRVKLWSTFNEADVMVWNGYAGGSFPPYHKDIREGLLACHYCLLAHFRAVRLYRSMDLGGKIGAVNCCSDFTPSGFSKEDLLAVKIQFMRHLDWFTEPMFEGHYPQELLDLVPYMRDNMPEHYQEDLDREFVRMDFIGFNYYESTRTGYDPEKKFLSTPAPSFYAAPGQILAPYPPGMLDLVDYIRVRYGNPEMYITENGLSLRNTHDKEAEIHDPERVAYLREHLRTASRLIRNGANLKGYFYWNDADSYEAQSGHYWRFGLTWVDHETGERVWKDSRRYFSEVCRNHRVN